MPHHLSPTRTLAPSGRPFGRTATRIAAMALVLVAGVACSDDDNDPVAPDPVSFSLSESSVTLVRGTGAAPTKQVNVEVTGTSNANVTWTAFRPSIATITPGGLITGLADGETFFTATSEADPKLNRTVVVNVVSTIVRLPNAVWGSAGGPTRTLSAVIVNNANTNVTWTSSNPAVATVSATGVVTPLTTGSTTITATSVGDPTKSASTAFTVDPALEAATVLTSGTGVSGLSATAGTNRYFRIEIPLNATNLTVALTGATSDVDLFVTAAALPTVSYAATPGAPTRCFAATASGNESCSISSPQLGRVYYVLIDAYESYSGVRPHPMPTAIVPAARPRRQASGRSGIWRSSGRRLLWMASAATEPCAAARMASCGPAVMSPAAKTL